jgi:hypothetical protein
MPLIFISVHYKYVLIAKYLVLMDKARNKTPAAQRHMMVNMPVKFHYCDNGVMNNTRLHAECMILKWIRGHNSGLNGRGQKQKPRCKVSWLCLLYFWTYMRHKFRTDRHKDGRTGKPICPLLFQYAVCVLSSRRWICITIITKYFTLF